MSEGPRVRPLVLAELRERRRTIPALALAAFVFFCFLAATYEALGGASELRRQFGVELPSIYSAFAGTTEDLDLFAPRNYLAIGFLHPLFLVIAFAVGLSIGTAAIAGDVETGRAEMVFTAPIRRTRVLDGRIALWALAQLAVVGAALAGALAGSLFSPDIGEVGLGAPVRMTLQFLPLVAFVGALAFTASAVSSTRGRALGLAVGATVLAYLVNFVALLWEPLDPIRWATPFRYYVPVDAARSFDVVHATILVAATAALLVAARRAVERRDLI